MSIILPEAKYELNNPIVRERDAKMKQKIKANADKSLP